MNTPPQGFRRTLPDLDNEPMDYVFKRLTAVELAKAMIGDVRIEPATYQIELAQLILDRTGTLFRMVAGFNLDEWEHK